MSELHFMSLEKLDHELEKDDSGIYFIK
ncbi:nucleotide excision repair endonuclease, partial [Bacillus cereus]|nr:nucleotide excision repair endonuclease [Bacillus cereus]